MLFTAKRRNRLIDVMKKCGCTKEWFINMIFTSCFLKFCCQKYGNASYQRSMKTFNLGQVILIPQCFYLIFCWNHRMKNNPNVATNAIALPKYNAVDGANVCQRYPAIRDAGSIVKPTTILYIP